MPNWSRAPYKKGVSREQEVAQVSRTLRLLSMELNIPILVLRSVER
jgi:replicative DNA helicase